MAIRTYDILLDSYNSTIPEPIVGRQGDKNGAVTLHVTITDRGTAVDLTGQTINLMAETAKGTAIVADNDGVTVTNATGGKFDYAIPNALWSEAGKIKRAYFSLNDADGQQTTYDLIFIVKKAVDISQDKADDYISIIDGTLRSLKEKINAMNTDVQTVLHAYNQGDFYNKSETDDKDTATLSSAKKYADDKDTATLSSAKKYADDKDTATLSSAEKYTDNKISALPPSTPWQNLTLISPFTPEIEPQVRRIGSRVYFTGRIGPGNVKGDMFNIPVGFRPSHDIHLDLPQMSSAIDYRSRIYIIDGMASIVAFNGDRPLWIDPISYYTDDPMPS